jgi:Na+/H+-dicarboxylate symporter
MANKYSVLLNFLVNSNSHSVFKFKGKIKFIAVTYSTRFDKLQIDAFYTFFQVGILLGVDWLLDPILTSLNVLGDAIGTGIVNELSKDDLKALV